MFAKIVRGKDLPELEKEVNNYLSDNQYRTMKNENAPGHIVDKKLVVYNVQQFVIGEVDPKSVSIINQQSVPKYSFCLLLICGYE